MDNEFGKKLQELRQKKGLSQKELALKLAVSNKTISKWECGRSLPDLSFLPRLTDIFDVSADSLLGILDKKEVKKPAENVAEDTSINLSPTKVALKQKGIKKWQWLLTIYLAMLPFLIATFFYLWLPETLPMHYNGAGEIDRWASRKEIIMMGALLSAIPAHLPLFIRFIKSKNIKNTTKTDWKICLWTINVMSLTYVAFCLFFSIKSNNDAILAGYTQSSPDVVTIATIVANAVILILGVILPVLKPNNYIGIRLDATLNNPKLWYKAHEFGAVIFIFAGLIGVFLAVLLNSKVAKLIYTILVPAVLFTMILLYLNYIKKSEDKRTEEGGTLAEGK